MPNYNTEAQPLLFTPGQQGWKTPKPNKRLLPKTSMNKKKLKTKQLQEHLGVSDDFIRRCHMGEVRPWKAYLIWHQGRDAWKVYEEKLTV